MLTILQEKKGQYIKEFELMSDEVDCLIIIEDTEYKIFDRSGVWITQATSWKHALSKYLRRNQESVEVVDDDSVDVSIEGSREDLES